MGGDVEITIGINLFLEFGEHQGIYHDGI